MVKIRRERVPTADRTVDKPGLIPRNDSSSRKSGDGLDERSGG